MVEFVSNRLNIPSNDLICQILVKKDSNLSELEYVSFKIGIKEDIIGYVFDSGFWPPGVICRNFEERRRPRQH